MHHLSISALQQGLRAKKFSSVELVQHFLNRIAKYDKDLNCFITKIDSDALNAAKQADQQLHQGTATPLTGIPIAHKDIFCADGVRTTCGSKMLESFIAPYDATVVKKFKNSGAIMIGKTNMDEFAMGSSNETSYFGLVKNPWNKSCVPGGSSGGSAAAVAARLTPAATGTDTGGSIRQPAALCGITGLKPTYGCVSRWGMIAFASSLDQAGPMAHSAEDCAILLQAMAGFDEHDSTSIQRAVPTYLNALSQSLKGKTIGVPKEYFSEGLKEGVKISIEQAIQEVFVKLGCNVKEIALPHTHLAVPAYYVVAPAECSSNLARYDGVRYGHRCDQPKDLFDLYTRSRSEGFGKEVKRRIMIGTYVLSAGYYDAYYLQAQKIRTLISQDFIQAFKDVDVIIGPTAPEPAFSFGAKSSDPVTMYLSDIYTIAVNLAGIPAISIPVGFDGELPVGMQLIANSFEEDKLLNFAHQYQLQTDWHTRCPQEFNN